MIRVLSIFGTRPEAIKMAPLVRELNRRADIESLVCVTAQHRFMLDQVLTRFEIVPDYDLNIMHPDQSLSEITCAALEGLESVIRDARSDIVLVHGDTSSSLAGALAAFYQKTAIGHVEAGLRSYDKYSPFPEEMNRQIVDRLSDLLFAPTELSRQNLLKEHIAPEKIYVTGNTAIDALSCTLQENYTPSALDWIGADEDLILLTTHRRENWGEPMCRIFRAVRRIAENFPTVKILYPVHPNPQIRSAAKALLSGCDRIRLIEPPDVFDFHHFLRSAALILTDSGGIQEEAPALGKPVLVLRDTSERPEGLAAGTLKLVGSDEELIFSEASRLLRDRDAYEQMSRARNPYGDGHASERIAAALEIFGEELNRHERTAVQAR